MESLSCLHNLICTFLLLYRFRIPRYPPCNESIFLLYLIGLHFSKKNSVGAKSRGLLKSLQKTVLKFDQRHISIVVRSKQHPSLSGQLSSPILSVPMFHTSSSPFFSWTGLDFAAHWSVHCFKFNLKWARIWDAMTSNIILHCSPFLFQRTPGCLERTWNFCDILVFGFRKAVRFDFKLLHHDTQCQKIKYANLLEVSR